MCRDSVRCHSVDLNRLDNQSRRKLTRGRKRIRARAHITPHTCTHNAYALIIIIHTYWSSTRSVSRSMFAGTMSLSRSKSISSPITAHTCSSSACSECNLSFEWACYSLRSCACMRSSVRGCVGACAHPCVRACMHAYVRACMHACVRACVRVCVCVCVCTCIPTCRFC